MVEVVDKVELIMLSFGKPVLIAIIAILIQV